jgi:small subunit ribosomal protein S4
MGQPKKQRAKYDKPFRPWDKARLETERRFLNEYGLRRKQELWRTEAVLRNFRRRARELLGTPNESKERQLTEKLQKLGIRCSTLDEVLGVGVGDLLGRRLQTIIHKKGMANSVWHARQIIVHGHVAIGARKMKYPGYIVPVNEEESIRLLQAAKAPVAAVITE